MFKDAIRDRAKRLFIMLLAAMALLAGCHQSSSPGEPPVIISLIGTPSAVEYGASVRISWSANRYDRLTVDPGGFDVSLEPNGYRTFDRLVESTTFTLTAWANGQAPVQRQTTIGVIPRATLEADSATVLPGHGTTLRWNVFGPATRLVLDPGQIDVTGRSQWETPPLQASTQYTLSASNGWGSGQASCTVTVGPATGLPRILSFQAAPASVLAGERSTLSWQVTGATTLYLDPGHQVLSGESLTVSPTLSQTYTLVASNADGSVSAQATVTVEPLQVPTIVSFQAAPDHLHPGESALLSWEVLGHAQELSIDQGVGAMSTDHISVTPSVTTTYTLRARNVAGSAEAQVTVHVAPPGSPIIRVFTPNPGIISLPDGGTLLSWVIDGSANQVTLDPGGYDVTGRSSFAVANCRGMTTFTLSASNALGSDRRRASILHLPHLPPLIRRFVADPTSVNRGLGSGLRWTTDGTETHLTLDPGGIDVTGRNSLDLPPLADSITFTLTATGNDGLSSQARATVDVVESTLPRIASFTASPVAVPRGEYSTLSWTVLGSVDRLSLDPGNIDVTGRSSWMSPLVTAPVAYVLTARNSAGRTQAQVDLGCAAPLDSLQIPSLAATPPTVAAGEPTMLSWAVMGQARQLTLDPGGFDVTGRTSFQVPHVTAAANTFTLTAENADGSVHRSLVVPVQSAPALPEILSFTANPTDVAYNGSCLLTWRLGGQIDRLTLFLPPPADPNVGVDVTGAASYVARSLVNRVNTFTLRASNATGDVERQVSVRLSAGIAAP